MITTRMTQYYYLLSLSLERVRESLLYSSYQAKENNWNSFPYQNTYQKKVSRNNIIWVTMAGTKARVCQIQYHNIIQRRFLPKWCGWQRATNE